jgi:hypothetical protein
MKMPEVQDTNEVEYLVAVEEGKAIIADVSGKQWALGELALKVEKKYGENRLEQFAVDINFPGEVSTLSRYRSVCLAFPKTGGRPRFFASAQILQTHRDRIQIVTNNPIIGVRAARELMRQWHEEQGTTTQGEQSAENKDDDTEPTPGATTSTPATAKGAKARGEKKEASGERKPEWLRNIEGWFNNQVAAVNAVTNELNKIMEDCKPEQRSLLGTLEPTLLLDASQSLEKKSAEFVDWVDTPLEKAADALSSRAVVTPSPKRSRRASKPVQPEA